MATSPFPRFVVAGFLTVLLMQSVFTIWFLLDSDSEQVISLYEIPESLWQVVEGDGSVSGGQLALSRPDRMGWAAVAARLPEPSDFHRYGALRFEVEGRRGVMDLTAGIAPSNSLAAFATAPVSVADDGRVELPLSDLFYRGGSEFGYVVIRARGGMDPPLKINNVSLSPVRPSVLELQGMILRSLVNVERWTQRSINHQIPDHRPLKIAPVPTVLLWIVLSLAIYALVNRQASGLKGLVLPAGVFALAGWLLLDVFWQVRLWVNHVDAVGTYSGIPQAERRSVEVDGEAFDLIRSAKESLGDPSRRMLVFGDSGFSHYRGRYFAAPQPVISRVGLSLGWLRRARPGDTAVLINLPDSLVEFFPLSEGLVPANQSSKELGLGEFVGRDAVLGDIQDGLALQMKPEAHPWLIESGWHELDAGLWSFKVEIGAQQREGWVRLEVLAKDLDEGQNHRVAWREAYAREGGPATVSMPFWVETDQEVHVRLRQLDARGAYATAVQLESMQWQEGMVLLSTDGQPPYFLGWKLVETEAGVAYEIF